MQDLSKVRSILTSVRAKGNLFSPKVLAVGAAALGLSGALSFVAPFRGVAEATAKQTLNGASSGGYQYLEEGGKVVVTVNEGKYVYVSEANDRNAFKGISNGSSTGVQLTITGGTWLNVFGGFSNNAANCSDNVVTIDGTAVITGEIYGARSVNSSNGRDGDKVTYTNNVLKIQGGTIQGAVRALPQAHGTISNNVIYWSGGTICKSITGGDIIITGGTFSGAGTQDYNINADSKYTQLRKKADGAPGTLTIATGNLKIASGLDYDNGSIISIGSGAIFYVDKEAGEWRLDGKRYRWYEGGKKEDSGSKYYSFAKALTLTGAGTVNNIITIGNEDEKSELTLDGNLTITQIQGIGTVTVVKGCTVNTTLKTWTDDQVLTGATFNEENETLSGGSLGTPTGTLTVKNNGTVAKSVSDEYATANTVVADAGNISIEVTGGSLAATAKGTKTASAAGAYAKSKEKDSLSTITLTDVIGITAKAEGSTSATAYGIDNEGTGIVNIIDMNGTISATATATGGTAKAYGIVAKEKTDLETAAVVKSEGSGSISITATATGSTAEAYGIYAQDWTNVTLSIADITASGTTSAYGVYANGSSADNVSNVAITLSGTLSATGTAASYGVYAGANSNVEITGGTVTATGGTSYGLFSKGGTITATNVEKITGSTGAVYAEGGTVSITGSSADSMTKITGSVMAKNSGTTVNLTNVAVEGNVLENGGSISFDGSVSINGNLTMKNELNIASGDTLSLTGGSYTLNKGGTNDGTLNLNGGTNGSTIVGKNQTLINTNGTINVTGGSVTIAQNHMTISGGTIKVAKGSTFSKSNKLDGVLVENSGTVILGGTLSQPIIGGTFKTASTVTVDDGGLLQDGGKDNPITVIVDSGSLIVKGGTLGVGIGTESGTKTTLKINYGEVTALKPISALISVEYDSSNGKSGTLYIDANNVQNKVANKANLYLTGDGHTLTQTIECSDSKSVGTTYIRGNITADADLFTVLKEGLTTTLNVEKGYMLTFAGIGEDNSGILNSAITTAGSGTYEIASGYTLTSNTTLNGTVINEGTLNIDASNVGSSLTNEGTIQLTGGTLGNEISGGTVKIVGNVSTDVTYLSKYNDVPVNDGVTLTLTGGSAGTPATLGFNVTGADSTTSIAGNISFDGAHTVEGNLSVASGGTLNVTGANLKNDVANSGTVVVTGTDALTKTITGGSVTITGAQFSNSNLQNVASFNSSNAVYNFAATVDKSGESPTVSVDQIILASKGVATGTLKLGTIDLTVIDTSKWTVDTSLQVQYLVNAGDSSTITIAESKQATSGNYVYTFSQANGQIGYMNVLKADGYSLYEIVSATKAGAGDVESYTLIADYTEKNDLGTLTSAQEAAGRIFTIDGGGKSFLGSDSVQTTAKKGITLAKSGDVLNLNNISTISGWDANGVVVNTAGTVNISTTGTTTLSSKLAGAGTYNVTGGTLVVADAANLGMSTINNSGTINVSGSNNLTTKVSGGTLNIGSSMTVAAGNIAGEVNTIADSTTLTLTTGTLGGKVTGTGSGTQGTIAVTTGNTLTAAASDLGVAVTNAGTVVVTGTSSDKLEKTITGGDVTITGAQFTSDKLSNIGNFTSGEESGGSYSNGAVYNFTVTLNSSASSLEESISVSQISLTGEGVKAVGILNIGTITLSGENYTGWTTGNTTVTYLTGGTDNTIALSGSGESVYKGYRYTFTPGSTAGTMTVTKESSLTLHELVVATVEGASDQTERILTSNYTEQEDLGELNNANRTDKTFTIDGSTNHYSFAGGGKQGITVNNEDYVLNLKDISTISGWADSGVVDNKAGTVNISGTTTLSSYLKGEAAGTYKLKKYQVESVDTNSVLTVTDAKYLAMAGGINVDEGSTINLQGGTLGAKVSGGALNINGDVSAAANYIAGTTNTIANGKTLTLTGDIALGGNLSGDGSVVINGKVSSDKTIDNNVMVNSGKTFTNSGIINGAITNNGTLILGSAYTNSTAIVNAGILNVSAANLQAAVTNTGTVALNGGTDAEHSQTLSTVITGGTLTIAQYVSTDADNIKSDVNTVGSGGLLTFTGTGTLLKTVTGATKNTGTLTAKLADLGDFTNTGTLNLQGGLTGDIKGTTGTTVLTENIQLDENRKVEGTLNGNEKKIDMMTGDKITTLTVGTLGGTTALTINVDMSDFKADSLDITTVAQDAEVNLTDLNVIADIDEAEITLSSKTDDAVQYASYTTLNNGKFNVTEKVVTTNKYTYTFESGTTAGMLKYTVAANNKTFSALVTGTSDMTLSLTDAMDTGAVTGDLALGNSMTINLNAQELTSTNAVTVKNTSKTLTLTGDDGSTAANITWKNSDDGKMTIGGSGVVNVLGVITGNAIGVNGDATLAITADHLQANVANSGTISLGAGTLNKVITGGAVTLTGSVTTAGGNFVNTSSLDIEGHTLTVTGDNLTVAITDTAATKGNVVIEGTTTASASVGTNITIDDTGTLTIDAGNVGGAVSNSGTLNLGAGELAHKVAGGTLNITGVVSTNAANIAGETNTISNSGTLTLTEGTLTNEVTNNGTLSVAGAVQANVALTGNLSVTDKGTLTVAATNLQSSVSNSGTVNVTGTETDAMGDSVVVNGGTVALTKVQFDKDNLSDVKNLTVTNAIYNFSGTVEDSDTGITIGQISLSSDGVATGTLKIGTVTLSGKNYTSWAVGTSKEVQYLSSINLGSDITPGSTITVANTSVVFIGTDEDYTYTFSQAMNGSTAKYGIMNVRKSSGKKMSEIVKDPTVSELILGENYIEEDDIGELKHKETETGRTLTIDGQKQYSYIGMNHEGIILNSTTDVLNVKNITEIAGWKENETTGAVVNNSGTVNIDASEVTAVQDVRPAATTTLSSYLRGAGQYNLTGGTLAVTDAKYLAMGADGKGIATNTGTFINLQSGTLGGKITGEGTVNIQGEVSADADYVLANTTVESGKTLTLTEGTLVKDVTITNYNATVALDSKATLAGSVTGGTLEVIGTGTEIQYKSVDSNIVFKEGTAMTANLKGGTITMAENVTIKGKDDNGVETVAGTFTVKNGTTLVFNNETEKTIMTDVIVETDAMMDPIVSVFAEGVNVYVQYRESEGTKGGNLTLQPGTLFATIHQEAGSVIETTAESIDWGSEAAPNTNDKILFEKVTDVSQLDIAAGTLQLSDEAQKWHFYKVVSGSAVENGTLTEANLWSLANIKDTKDGANNLFAIASAGHLLPEYYNNGSDIAIEIRNIASAVEKNTSALAGVQQGALSMVNQAADVLGDNLSLRARPAQDSKYDRTIWANYISSKDYTEGLRMEGIEGGNKNTAQYHGVTLGADLYTSKKAIAGIALTYVSGDVTGNTLNTQLNNKTKYYGVTLYDRVNNGPVAWTYDIGYQNGKNEITQYACENITADAKTDALTAGIKVEQAFNFKHSTLAPFASFRYVRMQNKDYSNSNGAKFQTDNQNLFMPKVGLAWNGKYDMPKSGWSWQPSAEVGYLWNMGDRDVQGSMYMNTRNYTMDYDTADRSSFYAKLGMNFNLKNFTAGIAYRYSTGDSITNNKWNVNVSWKF